MPIQSLEKFLLKFNVQKLIGLNVDDDDLDRISSILSINREETEKILHEFTTANHAAAREILEEFGHDLFESNDSDHTIVFAGDSITSDRESYQNIILQCLDGHYGIHIIDSSISGDTTCGLLNRFHRTILAYDPDIVSILIGTNDMRRNDDKWSLNHVSPDEYARNIEYMIQVSMDRGIKLVLNTIPPTDHRRMKQAYGDNQWAYREEDFDTYNAILIKAGTEYMLNINDMRDEFRSSDYLSGDGIHLNADGQKAIARRLLPILARMTRKE